MKVVSYVVAYVTLTYRTRLDPSYKPGGAKSNDVVSIEPENLHSPLQFWDRDLVHWGEIEVIDGEEESEAVDKIALLQLVQTRCFG